MTIDKYYLTVCRKCFQLHGFVEERYNGKVPVLCFCDLSENTHKSISTTMISGCSVQNGKKTVNLFWKPISEYKDKNGQSWHVPYFALMVWGRGNPEDLQVMLDWVNEKNKL